MIMEEMVFGENWKRERKVVGFVSGVESFVSGWKFCKICL